MAQIQMLLDSEESYRTINYSKILDHFPWIVVPKQKCVISPDSDGLLCGLFMSHFLDWSIVGYYDGKVMLLDKDIKPNDVIFLDIEICRKEIRSIGHHMLMFKQKFFHKVKDEFQNCIQPNLMRDYDANKFRLKYPLATIHLLIGILDNTIQKISLPETAICPLFFTDGTFNVLFSYPENVLNWLSYLKANETGSALHTLFENDKYSVINLVRAMDEFFRRRDEISINKERGDRLKISSTNGEPYNIDPDEKNIGSKKIKIEAKNRVVLFIKILSETTGWKYNTDSWLWDNLKLYKFSKRDFQKDKKTITNKSFEDFLDMKPLSWAMTSGINIEYTLEEPDKMVE